MDLARAVELLSAVAQGINPFTGEVLAENCVCNQAEMIRALYCVLNEVNPLLEKKKSQPQNAWKPWTQEEEEQLLQEYRADMTLSAIAKAHGRSRGAIESRLMDLGEIEKRFFKR